jgi:hypothetical protein
MCVYTSFIESCKLKDEFVSGGYQLRSVTNGVSILPRKQWYVLPFIARWGEGLAIYIPHCYKTIL